METLGWAQPLPAFPGGVGQGGGLYYAEGLSRKVRQAWLQWPRHTLWFRYLLGLVVINSLDPFSLPFGYILMEV